MKINYGGRMYKTHRNSKGEKIVEWKIEIPEDNPKLQEIVAAARREFWDVLFYQLKISAYNLPHCIYIRMEIG